MNYYPIFLVSYYKSLDKSPKRNILSKEGIKTYKTAGHAVSAQLCCDLKITRLRSPYLKALA